MSEGVKFKPCPIPGCGGTEAKTFFSNFCECGAVITCKECGVTICVCAWNALPRHGDVAVVAKEMKTQHASVLSGGTFCVGWIKVWIAELEGRP